MQILWAKQALTENGWQNAVRIDIGDDGRIAAIAPNAPETGLRLVAVLPAPGNVHSHAFQRAMAGLTEWRSDSADSFWTWRRLMYRFLDVLTPDDVEAIAAFVQLEMLKAGYASTGEFHYLHHAPGGAPYSNIAEMSERILAARATTGIGLCHLPVLYMQGGCDGRALEGGQRRFGNDESQFARLVAAVRPAMAGLPADCSLGIAPHSLRAIPKEALDTALTLVPDGPLHMHLAEQQAEVVEVLAYNGARPVEWLLNIHDVGARWCLIHATQMTPAETEGLAKSGAVAGLCPITESNLGDGIFDGIRFRCNGGRFSIGSDSNIRISLAEELRVLDHSQRLRDHSRAAFATAEKSAARVLLEEAAKGGAQALARGRGVLASGEWADILALSADHPDMDGLTGDRLLDAYVFARDDRQVAHVWSAGRHLVADGRHSEEDAITARYRATVRRLKGAI